MVVYVAETSVPAVPPVQFGPNGSETGLEQRLFAGWAKTLLVNKSVNTQKPTMDRISFRGL